MKRRKKTWREKVSQGARMYKPEQIVITSL